MTAPKSSLIRFDRPGHTPAFIRSLSRDGGWVTVGDRAKARRFTPEGAAQAADKLRAAAGLAFTVVEA